MPCTGNTVDMQGYKRDIISALRKWERPYSFISTSSVEQL
jgi:hypothetical protein